MNDDDKQATSRRARAKALLPVPKVLLPTLAGCVNVAGQWVATGNFSRVQLAQLVVTGGYALIGYFSPRS